MAGLLLLVKVNALIIRIIDIETLGLEPADGICEVGWVDLDDGGGAWKVGEPQASLINPRKPIPPAMSAIHHIINDDVKDAPTLDQFLADSDLLREGIVLAAHKASFEQSFLDPDKVNAWIDTWKLAIHMAPHAPTHSNQGLRYWLKLAVDPALSMPPHRAGPDAYVTACILARMLAKISVEEALEISKRPANLPYLTFGMHAMKPIAEVPESYFDWIMKQDFDEDVKHTAFTQLSLRRAASSSRA